MMIERYTIKFGPAVSQKELEKLLSTAESPIQASDLHKMKARIEIVGDFDDLKRVADIFIEVDATLKEPKSVVVSEYCLDFHTPEGARRIGKLVDDIPVWGRVITSSTADWKSYAMEAMPKEFNQRGERVRGWLHFALKTKEHEIYNSTYTVSIASPHGSNQGSGRTSLHGSDAADGEDNLFLHCQLIGIGRSDFRVAVEARDLASNARNPCGTLLEQPRM